MDLSDLDLLQLQSRFMQGDQAVIGMSAAIGKQLRDIAASVDSAMIYSSIDALPEETLDILAWEFGADWYDANAQIETKRQAINDVLYLAQIRGTPAAVQRVVEIYFGSGAVEEWWEYGGDPYFFRVTTDNPAATAEQAALLARAVQSVKNLRSRLEAVIIQAAEQMPFYEGFALQMTDTLTVEQVV